MSAVNNFEIFNADCEKCAETISNERLLCLGNLCDVVVDGKTSNFNMYLSDNTSNIGISGSTFLGMGAGNSKMSGGLNTLIGNSCGFNLTTGNANTLIGTNTGYNLTSGSSNTLIGNSVGSLDVSGTKNIAIGTGINFPLNTNNNIYVGNLLNLTGTGNSTVVGNNIPNLGAVNNTVLLSNGPSLLSSPTNTLTSLAVLGNSISIGSNCSNSVAVGAGSVIGDSVNFGNGNCTAVGFGAQAKGNFATAIGHHSSSTGLGSVAIGGGNSIPSASATKNNSIVIGANATDAASANASSVIVLGTGAAAKTNTVGGTVSVWLPLNLDTVAGTAVTYNAATGEVGPTVSSERFKKNIRDLDFETSNVFNLSPRCFEYKETSQRDFGLVAEEVVKEFPELVPLDKEGLPYSVRYELLSVILLSELKKVRKELDEVKATLSKV